MRIVVAHNRYRIRGGEDVVVDRECELLEAAGHEVIRYFRSSDEIVGPLATLRVARRLPWSESEKAEFGAFLAKTRPEVVHIHNTFPLLTPAVFEACTEAGVPAVFTLHNFRMFCANALFLREGKNCELCLEQGSPWPGVRHACYQGSRLRTWPVARLIEQARARDVWRKNVSAYICATHFAKGKFLQGGLPESRVHVKRHFSPDLARKYRRREGSYALYLGRLSEEKGIRTLLEAWSGPKEQLVFLGDGPLAGEIRARGFEVHTGLEQDEVFRWLAECQFLVMPSECYESAIPLVLLEAISLQVPIVTSRFGAAEEVFRHGENAWIFTPGRREELASALESCAGDMNERRKRASAARKTFEEHFRPEQNLERILEIYRDAIERRV